MRQRSPRVWEIHAYLGRDAKGKPVQVSRTVRGGRREAQRIAAELTLKPAKVSSNITLGELLDLWIDQRADSWAPQTLHNNLSRVRIVKRDPIAKIPLVRLTAVDVDRWHARLSRSGVGDWSIRNQHLVARAAVNPGRPLGMAQHQRGGRCPTRSAQAGAPRRPHARRSPPGACGGRRTGR